MELKKLHMGTMSYGSDSMDEVAHQLATAFGATAEQRMLLSSSLKCLSVDFLCLVAQKKATMAGTQLTTRGRRDISSRVRDVVMSLALCHNVSPSNTDQIG